MYIEKYNNNNKPISPLYYISYLLIYKKDW